MLPVCRRAIRPSINGSVLTRTLLPVEAVDEIVIFQPE